MTTPTPIAPEPHHSHRARNVLITLIAVIFGVGVISAVTTDDNDATASTTDLSECKDQPITRWWDSAIDVAKAADDGTTTTTEPEYETFMYEVAAVTTAGEVGDDGTSITFDTEGEEDYSGDTIEGVAAALIMLGTPDHVIARMDQTRALDGTQDATWEFDGVDYAAFWNYHPDSGMNLTVYEA